MSNNNSISFLKKNINSFLSSLLTSKSLLFFLFAVTLFYLSCAPAKRFPEKDEKADEVKTDETSTKKIKKEEFKFNFNEIRVSMQGLIPSESLIIESRIFLYDDKNKLALDKIGNTINCYENNGKITLEINDRNFDGQKFVLVSAEREEIIKINGKKFRGKIQISSSGNSLEIVNVINLEDYVKGVLAKEMPVGKNGENFEALKALAVCIRTYAAQKIKDGKMYFDIYADTRDQVYGGLDAEKPISNLAVNETNNLILKYDGTVIKVFYHSTCGGFTESSQNVFTEESIPYLTSIEDGSEPYCKISPRFEWTETYSNELLINRLKNYSLIDDMNYSLEDISILSRFKSGRVDEMEIILVDENNEKKSITIKGNEIRSILRTADGKNILWSTLFDLSLKSNSVVIKGKGFGHGVGLCQWGAIALSRKGWNFEDILIHYYPGTETENIND